MSKYLVIPRRADSPMTHAGGSTEETICEIAKNLLHYPGPSDFLMAIAADSKVATLALVKDDALCSVDFGSIDWTIGSRLMFHDVFVLLWLFCVFCDMNLVLLCSFVL